jgi:hypothetical protein
VGSLQSLPITIRTLPKEDYLNSPRCFNNLLELYKHCLLEFHRAHPHVHPVANKLVEDRTAQTIRIEDKDLNVVGSFRLDLSRGDGMLHWHLVRTHLVPQGLMRLKCGPWSCGRSP